MKKDNNSDDWALLFFSERCRVLEFYVASLIAMIGGVWGLWRFNLCDEIQEKILIGIGIFAIHLLFIYLWCTLNDRLKGEKSAQSTEVERFGQGKLFRWGFAFMIAAGILLVVSVSLAPACKECDTCKLKNNSETLSK